MNSDSVSQLACYIIHMGGRIYDPNIGRFLQADPIVQAPKNSQSYNRFAYVFNNPMTYTDPSGYSAWTKFRDKFLKPVVAIGISVWSGGIAAGYGLSWAGFGVAAAGGAAAGYVATGSLKGAATGAFSAVVFFGVGQYFQGLSDANNAFADKVGELAASVGDSGTKYANLTREAFNNFGGNLLTTGQVAGQIASHAVLGGVIADLSGGKFGHGFFAAGVTKGLGTPLISATGDSTIGGTLAASIIGGTASKISGGKFANGAMTAAYQTLFNHLQKKLSRGPGRPKLTKSQKEFMALNAGLDKALNGVQYSYGGYGGVSAISPAGGVNAGLNRQYFSDGSSDLFGVAGVGWGWDLGAGSEGNFALYLGEGNAGANSWTGRFNSYHLSVFGYTGSYFYGGDWHGVSVGVASDGFAASYQVNEYHSLTGN